MNISVPSNVQRIMDILNDTGFENFIVGGCCRDSILGIAPHDWDITTDARPEQTVEIFQSRGFRVITTPTGLAHGTVIVHIQGEDFEITTFRADVSCDGRHAEVAFVHDIEADLARRDITINAMAWNQFRGLVDPFGGMSDLQNGIIRAVGNPAERFQEDFLRMMRVFRFAARFGFQIEDDTRASIWMFARQIATVSPERFWSEFIGIMRSANPEFFADVWECGILEVFIPEFCSVPFAVFTSEQNFLPVVIFSGFCHRNGIRAGEAEIIMRRLHVDGDFMNPVISILNGIENFQFPVGRISARFAVSRFGIETIRLMFSFFEFIGCHVNDVSTRFIQQVVDNGDVVSVRQLVINGRDVVQMGFSGRAVGDVLNACLGAVMQNDVENNADALRQFISARFQ